MSCCEKYAQVCVYILPTSVNGRFGRTACQRGSAAYTRHMVHLLFMFWQCNKFATLKLPYFSSLSLCEFHKLLLLNSFMILTSGWQNGNISQPPLPFPLSTQFQLASESLCVYRYSPRKLNYSCFKSFLTCCDEYEFIWILKWLSTERMSRKCPQMERPDHFVSCSFSWKLMILSPSELNYVYREVCSGGDQYKRVSWVLPFIVLPVLDCREGLGLSSYD